MTSQWQPYREPLRNTLLRNGIIAIAIGAVLSRLGRAPLWIAILLALWPSFGGHWVEVFFLNWLRPRISASRGVQIATRFVVWFAGGVVLLVCMALTARAVAFHPKRRPAGWIGGLAFIGIELVAHLPLLLRGRPCFYNGRG